MAEDNIMVSITPVQSVQLARLADKTGGTVDDVIETAVANFLCHVGGNHLTRASIHGADSFAAEVVSTPRGPSWQTGAEVRANIGNVTRAWLYQFAATHAADVRRMGDAKNCRLLYRAAAVADALERKEACA